MKPVGVAFIKDYRPDRHDFDGYSAVVDSLINPIIPHMADVPYMVAMEPQPHWLNVRFYTWPQPQGHVFISHGIADKNYRSNSKVYGFEYVHSTGPWWTDYYTRQGRPRNKIIQTGYTKLDPLFEMRDRFSDKDPNRINVLWAPTHAGINGTSRRYPSAFLELREQIATLLPDKQCRVVVAPHPRNREPGVTLDEYLDADVVIADAGSTIYEAWALDIPVVFPDWIVKRKIMRERSGTMEGVIFQQGLGYHAESTRDLLRTVEVAAHNGIGERENDLIEQVFPRDLRGRSGAMTAEALCEIAGRDIEELPHSLFFWVVSPDGRRFENVTEKAFTALWRNKGYTRVSTSPEREGV